ncbi:MAG: cyclopropane-fatty-acyl-phospholipid synthase family protein [Jatrophihabitans sp.]|uniref:SAM-dependent methyltransferase n=1 Tax=Jatrophihabitans sp. TaxID=1932789 RepID=UPI00390DF20B
MTLPEDPDPAAHYDRVTDAWRLLLGESLHYGLFAHGDESLADATRALTDRMAAAAAFAPGQRVLDVGCGTGDPACHLVRTQQVDVLGITTSAIGVERALARAAAAGLLGRARFEVRDGTDNGLPDETFDRVWALESSHLMPARDALIAECARVLRPGGRLVLCDLIRRRDVPFAELRARSAEFATLREAFGEARMDPLDRYLHLAEGEGLSVDLAEDLTDATLPTFDRWRANVERHRDEVTPLLGQSGVDAFARSADILESFWRDGTLGYGIFAAVKPS